MKKFYDKNNNRLVFIKNKADDKFWDKHWSKNDRLQYSSCVSRMNFVVNCTKKFLTPGNNKILEGGCGLGHNVNNLQICGYEVIGVDYAKNAICLIKSKKPKLDVRFGDVRNLQFENEYFDGYWSLGVIEHFYNGYDAITKEMNRVLKKEVICF